MSLSQLLDSSKKKYQSDSFTLWGTGCKLWFQKSIFFIQRNKTNVLKCSSLLQNSLRQFWWHIISTTNGWEEPGQWSTPAVSTHAGSTLGPAAGANTFWKWLCWFKYTKGLWFTIYGEFQSRGSLSHNFLRDSCPQVRQQKQLCAAGIAAYTIPTISLKLCKLMYQAMNHVSWEATTYHILSYTAPTHAMGTAAPTPYGQGRQPQAMLLEQLQQLRLPWHRYHFML